LPTPYRSIPVLTCLKVTFRYLRPICTAVVLCSTNTERTFRGSLFQCFEKHQADSRNWEGKCLSDRFATIWVG
jgi:hypothetical protein